MSEISSIVSTTLNEIHRSEEIMSQLKQWMEVILLDEKITAFYLSKNPDNKYSPFSEIVLSILTPKGLYGFDFQPENEDTYNYISLNKIERITEFQPKDTRSYVILLSVVGAGLVISDFLPQREEMQIFSRKIRMAIEELA